MSKRARSQPEKTPREIQAAELARRQVEWKNAAAARAVVQTAEIAKWDEFAANPTAFVKRIQASSPSHFCWFCFENDRELFVAGTTGVYLCQQCAASLGQLSVRP